MLAQRHTSVASPPPRASAERGRLYQDGIVPGIIGAATTRYAS